MKINHKDMQDYRFYYRVFNKISDILKGAINNRDDFWHKSLKILNTVFSFAVV